MSAAVAHRSAVALCFFYLFAAALAALALASGEIILIGLVLGALAGLILIERPGVTLGIVVIATLALAGPIVMHWPQAAPVLIIKLQSPSRSRGRPGKGLLRLMQGHWHGVTA